MAVLDHCKSRPIVQSLRLVGCIGIIGGCSYVCVAFSQLFEWPAAKSYNSDDIQLNQLVTLQLEDLFTRPWTITGLEWEWHIVSSMPRETSTNSEGLQSGVTLFPFSVQDRLKSHVDRQTGPPRLDSSVFENNFEIQGSSITTRGRIRDGNEEFEECSFSFSEPNNLTGKADGKTFVLRRKPKSPLAENRLLPIPDAFENVLIQKIDDGTTITNLLVRRKGTVALLDFWTELGYSVTLIVRPELPPETYLVMKNDNSLLVWHPNASNEQGFAVLRVIPAKLAKLLMPFGNQSLS
jgi:hypothetical protein